MRIHGWQVALDDVFRDARDRAFRWGRHDCCQFAARCVLAITGVDKRELFVPYANKKEALELLRTVGGMHGLLVRALGAPVPPAFAGEGDIVLIDMGRGLQPAVCTGLQSHAPGRSTLASHPTLSAVAAWKV
jgi:hypothetical protein